MQMDMFSSVPSIRCQDNQKDVPPRETRKTISDAKTVNNNSKWEEKYTRTFLPNFTPARTSKVLLAEI